MKKLMLLMVWSLFSSCEPRATTPKVETKVLKTYEVAPGTARELSNILSRLGPDVKTDSLPDGRVAVYASESFQQGVEPLLKSVTSKGALATIDFRVWQVIGKSAAKTSVGPGLTVINGLLEEDIARVYGPMEFSLFSPAQFQVVAGEHAEVVNSLGKVAIEGNVTGDRIFTRLQVSSAFEEGHIHFDTLVQLTPGKPTVLGQNINREKKETQTVFYVVTADVVH